MDRRLLTGVAVEVVAFLLVLVFDWIGVSVPLDGFDDGVLTVADLLNVVGLFLIALSRSSVQSYAAFRAQQASRFKNN